MKRLLLVFVLCFLLGCAICMILEDCVKELDQLNEKIDKQGGDHRK